MSGHLELETLSALLDDELDGAAAAAARAHIGGCPECAARLDGLRATVTQLRSLPAAEPPPHMREALRRQLAMEQEVRRRLWTLPGWNSQLAAWPAMAAAVFLAFGCGLFLYAYLLRHPAMIGSTAPVGQEGDWRATITYDRPPQDGAAGAAGPPVASAPQAQSRQAAADRVATSPPPGSAPAESRRERENALSKTLEPAPGELDELQATAEAAPEPRADQESAAAPRTAAAAAAPAPAPLAARRAAAEEPVSTEGRVLSLGPGVEKPVRISGEDLDLNALRDVRMRQPLVIVESVVGVDGVLHDVTLRPADIDPRLAAAVRKSLATWRFQPARKDGEPVAVRYILTVNIHLR